MWDAPSPAPEGYEVFYQVYDGDILSAGNTTNTELTLTSVPIQELSCFVVAFSSNAVPSVHNNVATAQSGEK